MTGEPFRAEWAIELLRAYDAAVTDAIAALRKIMASLIDSGRRIEAALVALDIVEPLVLSERHQHAKRLCSDLVAVFDGAQRLREAAAARVVTTRDFRREVAELRVE